MKDLWHLQRNLFSWCIQRREHLHINTVDMSMAVVRPSVKIDVLVHFKKHFMLIHTCRKLQYIVKKFLYRNRSVQLSSAMNVSLRGTHSHIFHEQFAYCSSIWDLALFDLWLKNHFAWIFTNDSSVVWMHTESFEQPATECFSRSRKYA